MRLLSIAVFGGASVALMTMAVGLIAYGCWEVLAALATRQPIAEPLLSGVGFIIIAVAVFDVAKFLIEEEVLTDPERGLASEARKSLTKFVSTISIALFLEGLVVVFRVSKSHVPDMIYPTFLLLAATLLVVGLGVYQKFSVTAERADDN